ncbi:hypothetical protein BKP45_08065 [Anaerobacillus alkalidiazotrophicus]|uniref:Uncharacterized protein n=1 Tax=Anaerobacillus alkalidiazotrophicus TaxID=472963 RepID=A0A1S2MAK8_9BACI|nr:hypothetical protein [Anaerobacillus alkalidiazotrophicus]OIJ20745.1 hypothetical protein BKP45_08065 [Anaerobacillus alkalidiazotrophicus]
MFEFSAMVEGLKNIATKTESTQEVYKIEKIKEWDQKDIEMEKLPLEDQWKYKVEYMNPLEQELQNANDAERYMSDDIGLNEKTREFSDPTYIDEIRAKNENVDQVLTRQEESLKTNNSDLNYQRVDEQLERYKGTVFEHQLKDTLKDHFDKVEDKQQVVQVEWGETKPDVILRGSLDDIKIGELEINKGEDLFIEAKCGSSDYIRNEMGHMLKQVEGHDGNSLVVVTKDYLDINPDVRAEFEKKLAEKNSSVYVVDVTATDVSIGLTNSLRL